MLLPSQRDSIVMPVHIALNAMETGQGSMALRHTIAAFLNIAGVCAVRMKGTAQETKEAIDAAKHALVESDKRYQRTGKFGFAGPEMLVMRKAVTLGDELIKRANTSILTEAVERVSVINARTPEVMGFAHEPIGVAA
jgi:hypothetical protein